MPEGNERRVMWGDLTKATVCDERHYRFHFEDYECSRIFPHCTEATSTEAKKFRDEQNNQGPEGGSGE